MKKQIHFEVDWEKHKEIKIAAIETGQSIKNFVLTVVSKELKKLSGVNQKKQ